MEFKLPELGENIEEAQVLRILVSEGDRVEKEQSLIEIETDKAAVEVPSPAAGAIESIRISEGDTVRIGQVLCVLREEESAAEKEEGEEAETKPESDDAEKEPPPDEGEGEGEGEDEDEDEEKDEDEEDTPAEPEPVTGGVPVFAAPSVRIFAREIGIDLARVPGSGPEGRVSIDDVKRFARETRRESGGGRSAAGFPPGTVPDFSQWGDIEMREMSAVRRKTAAHMSMAWSLPHVTLFEKADITRLEETRQRHREQIEKAAGAKLTLTAIFLKIIAAALRKHPEIAATADPERGRIIRKRYCHIGVAVDTPRGLLAPVLRDVDCKDIVELTAELGQVAERAREGKLKREEREGGVFTLSNLGALGAGFFTPIVNYPEGAILGLGRAATEPVFDAAEDAFEPRFRLPLSLSFDHRLIDGADGARFLHWIAQAAEEPLLALWAK